MVTTQFFLNEILQIKDKELLKRLEKMAFIETFKKGDEINEEGKQDAFIRFLVSGFVRGYLINHQGKENTTCFLIKTGEVIAGSMLLDGTPSEIRFQVIKEAVVFSVPLEPVMALRKEFPEINDLYIAFLSQWLLNHWETKKMLYLKTARDKYNWFLNEYPDLINYVPHTEIASFLNITPVSLSRIRNGRQ